MKNYLNYTKNEDGIFLPCHEDFSLDQTFNCGQCFRFDKDSDGVWSGVFSHRLCKMKQTDSGIMFYDITESDYKEIIIPYFDLSFDYEQLAEQYSTDPILAAARPFTEGIKILRQDPWETLCSFIISQNNNIKRIKGIVSRLCENFGAPLPHGVFSFPDAETVTDMSDEDFSILRLGFRVPYIKDAAKKVASGEINLSEIATLPYEDAMSKLMGIHGVGKKVANCVMLFGFHSLSAFPVDVWIRRALASLYPNGFPEKFREYGGVAQQYLFHYVRSHPEILG